VDGSSSGQVDHLGDFRPAVAGAQALGKANESLGLWLLAGALEVYSGVESQRRIQIEKSRMNRHERWCDVKQISLSVARLGMSFRRAMDARYNRINLHMNVKQAKDFLVQQTVEQASIGGESLSDLEKRMMYVFHRGRFLREADRTE